jgi:site-specific recombinase XerD
MPEEFKFSGYLEPEEVHAVITAIGKISMHPERDELLAEVLWETGGRVSEVITMIPEHVGMTSIVLINLKQRISKKSLQGRVVRNEDGKIVKIHDPNAIKEVEVSAELCKSLKEYISRHDIQPGQFVFQANRDTDKPLSRWYVWNMLTKASEKAQVFRFGKHNPATGGRFKGVGPHTFRHSTAMHLLEETNNVMIVKQQLGHASVVTTQGYAYAKGSSIKKVIKDVKW